MGRTKQNSAGNKAAIYARFSSDNQREESIDAQLRAATAYAQTNGYNIVKVYTDRAKSATTDKRPEFQSMIKDSEMGLFDVIIVHKLDRFSRNKEDSVRYKGDLKRRGIRVISVLENLDDRPESILLEGFYESLAQYYSVNLAREVMKGLMENAYKCMHTGGKPPLGYDVDKETRKYVINECEAITIREIFRLYNDGYGYDKIIDALNTKGMRTKRGKPFGKNSLHEIIANEKYAGVYIFNRSESKDAYGVRNHHLSKEDDNIIRIEGGVPAIISKEDYQKATQRMEGNRRAPGRYKAKETYLLSGLIFCGECGGAMSGNSRIGGRNKQKYVSYRCGTRDRNRTCENKEIRKDYIEAFVISELERLIFNEDAIPKIIERLNAYRHEMSGKNKQEAETLRAEAKAIEKQLSNIVDAISSGYAQSALKERLRALEERNLAIETRLQEISQEAPKATITEDMLRRVFAKFKRYVAEKNTKECKKFFDSYVDKVLVFKDHVEVTLKVASSFSTHENGLQLNSRVKITKLLRQFRVA